MNSETNVFHEHVVRIGEKLGLRAEREISASRSGRNYTPRVDILWSNPFSLGQRKAIERVGACPPMFGAALPVAAWEVEGSDASTKGMQADLANLRVFGAPYGFLAVRGGTKDNLYERAHRLTRTQRHHFGDQVTVPLDTKWLGELAELSLSPDVVTRTQKPAKGGGGEGDWAQMVRTKLRQIGEDGGFEVMDSFRAPFPPSMDLTRSEIDLVWTIPMPAGLRALAARIGKRQPDLVKSGLVVPERYDRVVVVAFEIENDGKKHGHGGILNLASHGMAGVFVAGTPAVAAAAEAARMTYREVLPLSRVTVFEGFVR